MEVQIGCFIGSCVDTDPNKPKLFSLSDNPYLFRTFHSKNHEGNTKLHHYIIHPLAHYDLLDLLKQHPLSFLNSKNVYGMTALHLGAIMNRPLQVRELIIAGANPTIQDEYGYTPLHYVCVFGHDDMIDPLTKPYNNGEISRMKKKLIKIPDLAASLRIGNHAGEVPLHLACKYGQTNIVKLFIENGLM